MRMLRGATRLALIPILLAIPLAGLAQDEDAAEETAAPESSAAKQGVVTPLTSGSDRLFISFVEDAAIIDHQWWEGQFEYLDQDAYKAYLLNGVVAFQPWKRWELGARLGFGSSDTPSGIPDGTGATDLDLWGKYYLGQTGDATEFSAGGIVTVPTGDDAAGLGYDAFAFTAFGAMRHRFRIFILSVNIGAVFNGDGQIFGDNQLNGKTAPRLGAGFIFPRSDRFSLIGEFFYEGERFDGGDSDSRILGGVNWRLQNRGSFRGALGVGLTNGAPDLQIIAGYAFNF